MFRGNHLAIGTDQGHVHIWDVVTNQNISSRFVHTDRIGKFKSMSSYFNFKSTQISLISS